MVQRTCHCNTKKPQLGWRTRKKVAILAPVKAWHHRAGSIDSLSLVAFYDTLGRQIEAFGRCIMLFVNLLVFITSETSHFYAEEHLSEKFH